MGLFRRLRGDLRAPERAKRELERDFRLWHGVTGQVGVASN